MVKLVYTADLKSAGTQVPCGFESHSRYQLLAVITHGLADAELSKGLSGMWQNEFQWTAGKLQDRLDKLVEDGPVEELEGGG